MVGSGRADGAFLATAAVSVALLGKRTSEDIVEGTNIKRSNNAELNNSFVHVVSWIATAIFVHRHCCRLLCEEEERHGRESTEEKAQQNSRLSRLARRFPLRHWAVSSSTRGLLTGLSIVHKIIRVTAQPPLPTR